jgi:DNA-binding CsgD family transcriptional regulator
VKAVDEGGLIALVDGIYDAAASFDRWPSTLKRIADALGARDAALGTMTPHGMPWLFAPRTDPAYLESYAERFHPLNHFWHGLVAAGAGAVLTDPMVVPRETLLKSAYHNEWARPQGYRTKLGSMLIEQGGWRTIITLPGRDDFGADAVHLFRLLTPHLARAVQLNVRLSQAEADSALAARLLAEMKSAALIVSADAKLLFANPAAEALFAPGQGLRLTDGALAAERREDAAALGSLIAGCAIGGGGTARLSRPFAAPLSLLVVPLRREMPLLAPGQPAAILFDVSRTTPADTMRRLRVQYGLTAAEAAFALEIAKGDGKHAAAARRGISYATARSHLSRIFDKTGARRQAELTRLLADPERGF